MKTLLTYDVSGRHKEVKDYLIARGYQKIYKESTRTFNLPNTTLWKNGIQPSEAIVDIKAAASNQSVKLERAFAVDFNNVDGILGDTN